MNSPSSIREVEELPLLVKIYLFFWGVVLLGCVGYSIWARTVWDFLLYVTLWSFLAVSFLVHLSFEMAKTFGRTLPQPSLSHFLRALGRAVPLAFVTYGVIVSVRDLYGWLAVTRYEVIVAVIALILGGTLFQLRQSLRVLYGVSEVLVGVLVATYRYVPQSSLWDFETFLPFLSAGVYLVVRGFDNIHQGIKQDPADPLVTWLEKALRIGSEQEAPSPRKFKKLSERKSALETIRSRRKERQDMNAL